MTIVKTDFESLLNHEYMKYLDKAEKIQQMGLHLDKSVVELANIIYQKTGIK